MSSIKTERDTLEVDLNNLHDSFDQLRHFSDDNVDLTLELKYDESVSLGNKMLEFLNSRICRIQIENRCLDAKSERSFVSKHSELSKACAEVEGKR